MIDAAWISEALGRDDVGVVTLSPSGGEGYAGRGGDFHDFSFVAQVARLALDMHLIQVPVK